MTRKFKMVSVLVAVVAMFAVAVSSASASFTSAAYPAAVTGSSEGDVVDIFGSTAKCIETGWTNWFFAPSTTATVTPIMKKCTAFGLPATVNFTSCYYLFHKVDFTGGTLDLSCSKAGDSVDIKVYSSTSHTAQLCEVNLPAQSGKSGYVLTNEGGKIKVSGTIGGLTAKVIHRTSISCPAGPEESGAKYTIQAGGILLSGNNGAISAD